MSFVPFKVPLGMTATQIMLLAHMSGASASSGGVSWSVGVYTMSGSTASLASSGSVFSSWTSGSNSTASTVTEYGNVSGTRYRAFALASWALSPGDYLFGFWGRSTNAGTWTFWGLSQDISLVSEVFTSVTAQFLPGFSTSSFSSAFPASLNLTNTNYVRTGSAPSPYRQIGFLLQGSV